jgi:hypothetical protein
MPNNFWWVAGTAAIGTIIGGLCVSLWSLMTRPTADVLEVLGRVAGRAMIGACIGWALALVLAMVQWLHFYNLPLKPEGWVATFSNVFVASTVLSMVLFVIAVVAGLPVIVSGGLCWRVSGMTISAPTVSCPRWSSGHPGGGTSETRGNLAAQRRTPGTLQWWCTRSGPGAPAASA